MNRSIALVSSFATDWIRYSEYEYRSDESGNCYITPAQDATFTLYDPFDEPEALLLALLRIGDAARICAKRQNPRHTQALRQSVLQFAKHYGLLGLISACTFNRNVLGDQDVILTPKNVLHLSQSTLNADAYVSLFTPFAQEDDLQIKRYKNSVDLCKREDSPKYYGKRPLVTDLIFSRFYAEQLDWFLAFAALLSEHFDQLLVYRASGFYLPQPVTILSDVFEARKIGFTITQQEQTSICWQFDSLLTALETIYAFAVTDTQVLLCRCAHCGGGFFALSNREKYCSAACRNRANVKKSRMKKAEQTQGDQNDG